RDGLGASGLDGSRDERGRVRRQRNSARARYGRQADAGTDLPHSRQARHAGFHPVQPPLSVALSPTRGGRQPMTRQGARVLAGLAVAFMACHPTSAEKTVVRRWLLCEECPSADLAAVVALGDNVT